MHFHWPGLHKHAKANQENGKLEKECQMKTDSTIVQHIPYPYVHQKTTKSAVVLLILADTTAY